MRGKIPPVFKRREAMKGGSSQRTARKSEKVERKTGAIHNQQPRVNAEYQGRKAGIQPLPRGIYKGGKDDES